MGRDTPECSRDTPELSRDTPGYWPGPSRLWSGPSRPFGPKLVRRLLLSGRDPSDRGASYWQPLLTGRGVLRARIWGVLGAFGRRDLRVGRSGVGGIGGGLRGGIRGRGAGAQWGSCSSPETGGGAITIPRGQGGAAESSAGVVPGYPPNASSAGCCPGWPGAVLGGAWCGGDFPAAG